MDISTSYVERSNLSIRMASQVRNGLDPKRFTVRTASTLIAKSAAWTGYRKSEGSLGAAIKKMTVSSNPKRATPRG